MKVQVEITIELDKSDSEEYKLRQFAILRFMSKNWIMAIIYQHREIISRPDPLSGSGFYPIHPDPLLSAPDLPPSAPTDSAFDQIQPRASLLITIQP